MEEEQDEKVSFEALTADQIDVLLASMGKKRRGPGRPPGPPGPPKQPKIDKVAATRSMLAQLGFGLAHNEFRHEIMVTRPGKPPAPLEDFDEQEVRVELAMRSINVSDGLVHDVMTTEARKNRFHPVIDWLDELVWDGVPRLDTWMKTYLGVKDSPYTRKIGAATLIAAVRRVRHPGCKFDECLMLVSGEGTGKSSAIRALVPDQTWVTESLNINASPKQVVEGTRGVWIAEGAEMAGVKDVNQAKAFLSRQVDGPVREAYARNSTTVPRQFIVIGTTNEYKPLANETGARRFWPARTGAIELDALRRDRDLLWAEAAVRELFNEEIHITGELYDDVIEAQNNFSTADPWRETIVEAIEHLPVKGVVPVKVLWASVGVESSKQTHAMSVRMTNIMKKLGFSKSDKPVYCQAYGGLVRAYIGDNPFLPENFITALSAQGEEEIPDDAITGSLDEERAAAAEHDRLLKIAEEMEEGEEV